MIGGRDNFRTELKHSIIAFINKTNAVISNGSNVYNEESGVMSLFETAEPMIEIVNKLRVEPTENAGRFENLDRSIHSVIMRLVNIYKVMEKMEGIPSMDLPNLKATDEWKEYAPDEYEVYDVGYVKGELQEIIPTLEAIEQDAIFIDIHNGGYRRRTHRKRSKHTHRKRSKHTHRKRTHCKRTHRKRTHRKHK